MANPFVPQGPVEYIIFRLQGRWQLNDAQIKKIAAALYEAKNPDAQLLALQFDELEDTQLDLILPYLPHAVTTHLDDIPL